jgi:hypothetical protein
MYCLEIKKAKQANKQQKYTNKKCDIVSHEIKVTCVRGQDCKTK